MQYIISEEEMQKLKQTKCVDCNATKERLSKVLRVAFDEQRKHGAFSEERNFIIKLRDDLNEAMNQK